MTEQADVRDKRGEWIDPVEARYQQRLAEQRRARLAGRPLIESDDPWARRYGTWSHAVVEK